MRTEGENWLYTFLSNPSFDEGAIKSLQLSKIVGDDPKSNLGSIMIVSGFLGRMLTSQTPEKVEDWAHAYLDGVGKTEQSRLSILWFALALSQLPEAKKLLLDMPAFTPRDSSERMVALKFFDIDVLKLQIAEEWMLDLLWGCFWGSGDDAYLEPIARCLPWALDASCSAKKSKIGKAAFYTLGQNSNHFVRVMTAMSAVFERNPELSDVMVQIDDLYHDYNPHTM